tara:strand:+ start:473 stop:688 length:216 start_codon:yes stop_codon:yes gene_type:complete
MFSDERLNDRSHSKDKKMGKQWQNDGAVANLQSRLLPNKSSLIEDFRCCCTSIANRDASYLIVVHWGGCCG